MKMKNTIDSREISKKVKQIIKNNDFSKLEEEQKNGYYIEMKNKDNLNEIDGQIKKNNNTNLNKKSRSLRAEAINEKYQKYHG